MSEMYIGLMSGTSVDAIDAVLMDFSKSNTDIIATYSQPLDPVLRKSINEVIENNSWPQDVVEIDNAFAKASVVAIKKLLELASVKQSDILAIGSHGQTVWHQPHGISPCSIQIGNPQRIANETGIKTIGHFRNADIEAGGQGAPLACAYHAAVLHSDQENRAILNLGGIANLTYLPMDTSENIVGFDTGPANTLLDSWIHNMKGQDFDHEGEWAKSGEVNEELLNLMLKDLYFQQPPPKSTGREKFNLVWLQYILDQHHSLVHEEDIQATLLELTVQSIADAFRQWKLDAKKILVCGGGSKNTHLMNNLQSKLSDIKFEHTGDHGVPEQWMEAMAFAWLAKQHLENKPGNIPSVTGANKELILGEVFHSC